MTDRADLSKKNEKAIFAGGCFWCMVHPFDSLNGVLTVTSGYTGGDESEPDYEEVAAGLTGHREAVEIVYDPNVISYESLLEYFWRMIDPTDADGQFADRGSQYKTAVFYYNDEQKKRAQASKDQLQTSGKFNHPIVTEILPAKKFYVAEAYHQGYYLKNKNHYKIYHEHSGRGPFLRERWGK